MHIVLQNVRSFAGVHKFPLRPLTILLGENSSGKTTFLAMLSAILQPTGFPGRPAFNDAPYDLGSYPNIATSIGTSRSARSFSIGFSRPSSSPSLSTPIEVLATYISRAGQPRLSRFSVTGPQGNLHVSLSLNSLRARFSLPPLPSNSHGGLIGSFSRKATDPTSLDLHRLQNIVYSALFDKYRLSAGALRTRQLFRRVYALIDQVHPQVGPHFPEAAVRSLGPVRTKPKRTYDQIREDFTAEGEHIPILLARILGSRPRSQPRRQLETLLRAFGRDSGLLRSLMIRKLGTQPSDPFQILVSIATPPFNLTDVGYGVSQALPIVVQSILTGPSRTLLFQQPEVHLHPKAQAALGSFFATMVTTHQMTFVIETHSDAIVDRVRWEVARGTLAPKDVVILFFHRDNTRSRVYSLTLDRAGNIRGAPHVYRDFFLAEEMRLITRGKR